MVPKEWKLCPKELFVTEKVQEFLEWSSLRAWVRDWLRYCRWYYGTAMQPDVSIEDLFRAPVVHYHLKITRIDPQLVRFGLLWKVYNLVGLKGLSYKPPIFSEGHPPSYGGYPWWGLRQRLHGSV